MKTKGLGTLTAVVLVAGLVASVACDLHHSKVPGGAKPAGFKQLVRWDSCGASGQYCSEVIIFGHDDISFEEASREVEARYEAKQGWSINPFAANAWDDGGLSFTNADESTCFSLGRFNLSKYRAYIGAPDVATVSKLVEPYATVIQVSAGCG